MVTPNRSILMRSFIVQLFLALLMTDAFAQQLGSEWHHHGAASLPSLDEDAPGQCHQPLGKESPNPAYQEGYATWRKAFEQGEAGIFTVPVAEIVEFVEKAINQR